MISDEFGYGGSASLIMCVMDRLMSRALLALCGLIFQAEVTKFGTNIILNMFINISSGLNHNRQKLFGECFYAFSNFAHWKSLLSFSHPSFFSHHIKMWHGHPLPWDLGRVRLRRFCLIKYAHNEPFSELRNFGIPGFIFQAKDTKFGTHVGLNIAINISSEFYHNRKIFCEIFTSFPTSHFENHR